MKSSRTQSVPALERGLSLLEMLASSKHGLGLHEISRRLRIPRSSAYCLLLTLERHGYLLRDPQTHRYRFGLRLLGLANMALAKTELGQLTGPILRSLMEATGLTIHISVLEGNEVVVVNKVDPRGPFQMTTWVGKHEDLHSTSLGKAMLAFMPSSRLEPILKDLVLVRRTPNTITTMKKLREELARVRKLGYAVDNEEYAVGLRCVGAPIIGGDGRVVASISASGSTAQVPLQTLPMLAQKVMQAAAAISEQLSIRSAGETSAEEVVVSA